MREEVQGEEVAFFSCNRAFLPDLIKQVERHGTGLMQQVCWKKARKIMFHMCFSALYLLSFFFFFATITSGL